MPAAQETRLDDLDAVIKVIEAVQGLPAADQQRVFRWAAEKLGLAAASAGVDQAAEEIVRPRTGPGGADIRTFVDRKNPGSDVQFAATVAYFYPFEAAPAQQKDSITSDDLHAACRKAGRKRLINPNQALINAASLGVLDRVERGRFAVNAVGENLVAVTLPSAGSAEGAPGRSRPTRKRGRASRAANGNPKRA